MRIAVGPAQKLRVKEGHILLTINAPADFKKELNDLPAGVTVSGKTKIYNQTHRFVKGKAPMEKEMYCIIGLLKNDVVCWDYYPKTAV